MRNAPPRAVGILAGGGNLPIEIAASLKARGTRAEIIAFAGEADAALEKLSPTYVHWGQVGRIVKTLKTRGCDVLVIVGSVTRPDLGALKPDWGLFTAIPTVLSIIKAGGDDAVLRGVVRFFELKGITVVSPAKIAPELVIDAGPFADTVAPPHAAPEIALGFKLVSEMARFDLGQSTIIANGRIEALEDADGTDAMINRVSSRRRVGGQSDTFEQPTGVLVKRPKPGQDLRVDLPAIGPATIMRCAEANLSGLAVEAGKVLAIERDDIKVFANGQGLFIEGVRAETDQVSKNAGQTSADPTDSPTQPDPPKLRVAGRVRASSRTRNDAALGGQLLAVLANFDYHAITVVSRGHVLTVDDMEHRLDAISRSKKLRQWGDRRWRAKVGVVVVGAGRDVDEQTIKAAADAGLACIAVRLTKFAATVSPPLVELANKHRIAVIEIYPGRGT